jgi:SAM-dependent methyltransferase
MSEDVGTPLIEGIRQFWDRRPCNVRHSNAEVGSSQWSADVTSRKYFVEPHILDFADFPRWRYKCVLEIGCGIGTDTLQFLYNGACVDAVDLSDESLKLAAKRCVGFHPGWIGFHHCNAEECLPPGKYDLIYSFGALHHTPHPEKVLYKAYNRLNDDGELRIMVYATYSLKHFFGEQPEAQAGCPLAKTYSVREAKELVESCGFHVQSIVKTHIFPWRISDYKEYKYVKRWIYRWMPQWLFNWLEGQLGWHLLIVATK